MSPASHQAIKLALSVPRMGTYEAATNVTPALTGAIALYTWNAQLSAALMYPLHVCEVAVRNAVSEAITQVYGRTGLGRPDFSPA